MIYCFLADGFEEIEALGTVDILRRAGLEVTTVSVTDKKEVMGAHNIPVVADKLIDDVKFSMFDDISGAVYPGGMPGAETLSSGECQMPNEIALHCERNNIIIGAICAAPLVLGRLGILRDKQATCYPGFEEELKGALCTGEKVSVDGNIVTGRGPGCTIEFALSLVKAYKGEQVADDIRKSMQCDE